MITAKKAELESKKADEEAAATLMEDQNRESSLFLFYCEKKITYYV